MTYSDAYNPVSSAEHHYKPVDFDPFAEVEAHFPLTEPQREICAATLMGDDANCSYNQCFVLKLHGPLSVDSLHKALADVVRRHEALRISIDLISESQHVLPDVAVALPLTDLAGLEEREREAAIERIVDRETRTPFDLGRCAVVACRSHPRSARPASVPVHGASRHRRWLVLDGDLRRSCKTLCGRSRRPAGDPASSSIISRFRGPISRVRA